MKKIICALIVLLAIQPSSSFLFPLYGVIRYFSLRDKHYRNSNALLAFPILNKYLNKHPSLTFFIWNNIFPSCGYEYIEKMIVFII